MIRSAIRNEIQQRALDDGSIVTTSDLNTWIDLAVRALWYAYAWPFKSKESTITCTPNSKAVVLPTDVQEIKKLINTSLTMLLTPRNERFLQLLFPEGTPPAQPLFYCDGGLSQAFGQASPPVRVLHLYPVPDQNYTLYLRYQKLPSLPSQQNTPDSAYGPFPEDFDEAIIQWVLTRFFRKVGDVAQTNLAQQAYSAELDRMIALYSTMTEAFPMVDSEVDSGFGSFGYGYWGTS